MNRSLNRSLGAAPTTQDLTVGLIASIVSLAVTLLQNLNGTDRNNAAILLQAMAPIQDQLVRLLRRLKAIRLRHVPRMSLPPAMGPVSPRRTVPAIPASPLRGANVTFPTAPGDRTLPTAPGDLTSAYHTAPFFEYPDGWLDNSQENPDLSNIQDLSLDFGISGEGIDWPRDDNFSIWEDPDTSGSFLNHNATFDTSIAAGALPNVGSPRSPQSPRSFLNHNATFDTSTAAGALPNVGSPRSPQSPRRARGRPGPLRRQMGFDRSNLNQTFRTSTPMAEARSVHRPGTSIPFQIRESSNRRNTDGSLSQVSRTVSGPDVSMVKALETRLPPFQRH